MLYDKKWDHPTTKVGAKLWDAADYIEQHGWCQGYQRDPHTGHVCALGAIRKVAGQKTVEEFERYLQWKYSRFHIPTWNDAAGRTKEEVVAALRDAALTPQRPS